MMRRLRFARPIAASCALAVALGACNGAHSTSSALPPMPPPQNPLSGASGFVYASDVVRESQPLGPAQFGSLAIDVIVKPQNVQGLEQYAAAVADPHSSSFRHFLTPAQLADRFFASESDYAAAARYLERFGLHVAGWKQRFQLYVSGTQKQLEAAFHTKFGLYRHRGETYIAPTVEPSVPKSVPIVGSDGIVYRTKRFQPSLVKARANGQVSGYSPQQIQLAFDYAGAYNVNDIGTGITIGIIGTGPVSVESSGRTGDLDAMRAIYHAQGTNAITLMPVTGNVLKNGVIFSAPPPVTKPCNQSSNPNLPPSQSPTSSCNPEDGEAQADTEQTALLAPAAAIDYYLAYTSDDQSPHHYTAQGIPVAEAELQQAINDDLVDVLTISFGADEQSITDLSAEEAMYAALESEGVAVFAASGDHGAYACQDGLAPQQYFNDLCVSYPATDPNVTAVGGVNTPMNSAGQFTGPLTAWGETTSGGIGGTGGGVSAFIPTPKYQNQSCDSSGCIDQTLPGIEGSHRNVPDVSLDGDPNTGVAVVMDADPSIGPRQIVPYGGTSIAAPEMAAMWALVVGVCKNKQGCGTGPNPTYPYRTGVANPFLYSLYFFAEFTSGKNQLEWNPAYFTTFYDVQYGDNGQCFNATCPPSPSPTFLPGNNSGVGYDLTTGIGVPFARALIKGVTGL
jgi:kumamolisin